MEEGRTGVEVGDVVGGRWHLTDRLGQGAFGMVYKAEDTSALGLGEAAIKVLKRGIDSAQVLARFAQEQRALARLNHPHIAHLLDAGRVASDLGLPPLDPAHDRAMICGSAFVANAAKPT